MNGLPCLAGSPGLRATERELDARCGSMSKGWIARGCGVGDGAAWGRVAAVVAPEGVSLS